jgi:hypothetical protein
MLLLLLQLTLVLLLAPRAWLAWFTDRDTP